MADRIGTKSHFARNSFQFGMPYEMGFGQLTVLASQARTAVQGSFVCTVSMKIPLVSVLVSSASSGITAFNIAIGSAAQAGVLVASNADQQFPPTLNTTGGLSLFEAGTFPNFTGPQDYTTIPATAYGSAVIPTSEPDAIFPQGTVLTLRYVSGATVNGTVRINALCIPQDIYPSFAGAWTWGNTNIG